MLSSCATANANRCERARSSPSPSTACGFASLPMLTARGFRFFITVLALLGVSVVLSSATAALLCLTLLLWFLAEWFLFHWRLRAIDRRLVVTRSLTTSRGVVDSIWAGQRTSVRVLLSCDRSIMLPFVVMAD